jgi:hypothetical protein
MSAQEFRWEDVRQSGLFLDQTKGDGAVSNFEQAALNMLVIVK